MKSAASSARFSLTRSRERFSQPASPIHITTRRQHLIAFCSWTMPMDRGAYILCSTIHDTFAGHVRTPHGDVSPVAAGAEQSLNQIDVYIYMISTRLETRTPHGHVSPVAAGAEHVELLARPCRPAHTLLLRLCNSIPNTSTIEENPSVSQCGRPQIPFGKGTSYMTEEPHFC